MQTFLPYESYSQSARCLDPSRLGNQCWRETVTLLNGGWQYHPASKMWRDYSYSLCDYGIACAEELIFREKIPGIKWLKYFQERQNEFENTGRPHWLGREDFHASHRSNLLRKDFKYYSQFEWKEHPYLPYVWPV